MENLQTKRKTRSNRGEVREIVSKKGSWVFGPINSSTYEVDNPIYARGVCGMPQVQQSPRNF